MTVGKNILDFTESKGADFILASSLLDLHPFQSLWNALLQRGRSREHLKVITGRAEALGRLASDKPQGRGRGEYCFSTPLGINSHAQWLWLFQEPKLLPRADNSTFRIHCAVNYTTPPQTVL